MEQTIGEVWKDGHGLDAIEWTKMEQKKRKGCGSTLIGACVPDQLSVESAESTPIARWPRSVSMGMAGSGTVRPSPCAALLHYEQRSATRRGAPILHQMAVVWDRRTWDRRFLGPTQMRPTDHPVRPLSPTWITLSLPICILSPPHMQHIKQY